MASEAAEARKKHEQMHRKVSVACDCYGTPVTPGGVPIGHADPVESLKTTVRNRRVRQSLKKNNQEANRKQMKQQMMLDFSGSDAQFLEEFPRAPQHLGQHQTSSLLEQALKERKANHDIHNGWLLKRLMDETNSISLQDFTTRPIRTLTTEEAMQASKSNQNKKARAQVKALVAADNIDVSLPNDHSALKAAAASNPVIYQRYKKIADVAVNPQHAQHAALSAAQLKGELADRMARRVALSKSSIDFKEEGVNTAMSYRTSSAASCHADGIINASLDRLPMLSKTSKQSTIPHYNIRSAPQLRLPPI